MTKEKAKTKPVVNEKNQRKVNLLLNIEYHQQRIEVLHKLLERDS